MGAPHYTVALQKIAAEQGLTVLHAAQDYATREIRTADVNRPGLQLAGFYNYFDPERMQIIGRVESTYLETLTPDQRRERFEQFMRYNIIGLVICHGMDPFPECLEMAEKYDRNLFLVRKDTSEFMADLIADNENKVMSREEARTFGHITTHANHLSDRADMLREYSLQLYELHQTQIDLKQNSTMQILTIVTVMFAPLTLVTGWFGMNLTVLPGLDWPYMAATIITLALVMIVVMVLFFKRKRWL